MSHVSEAPKFVAVVDDEPSVRRGIERLLRAAGFAVRTFGSGAGFLEALRDSRPWCVVLDLHMPPPNGFDILEILQSADQKVPAVVISAETSSRIRERVLACGARTYLPKPVEDALLLEAVRAAAPVAE